MVLVLWFLFIFVTMGLIISNLVIVGLGSFLIVRLPSWISRIWHYIKINVVATAELSNVDQLVEVSAVVYVDELLVAILTIDCCNLIRWDLIWNVLDIVLGYDIDITTNARRSLSSNMNFGTIWYIFVLHLSFNFWRIVHLGLDTLWTLKSLWINLVWIWIYRSMICRVWHIRMTILPISI